MSQSDIIVGLDMGTTKICAIVGRIADSGDIEVIGIGSSPSTGLRKGVVVNIDQTVGAVRRALDEAETMAGCQIDTVYTGIAGSHIKSFDSHGVVAVNNGEVTQDVIDRAMEAAKAVAIPQGYKVLHTLAWGILRTICAPTLLTNSAGLLIPLGCPAFVLKYAFIL